MLPLREIQSVTHTPLICCLHFQVGGGLAFMRDKGPILLQIQFLKGPEDIGWSEKS